MIWRSAYQDFGKRLIDIVGSLLLLILILPLLLLLALLVRAKLGSPVLFRQQRGGLSGKPFELLKFRSMTNAVDSAGILLSDHQRLTRFGSFLRRYSLDELPALWNVLSGDMSLVGPRPFIYKYMQYYSPEQMRRHEVRPGITGYAQIRGRNALEWEKKFELDVWYVDHLSPWLDLKILFQTMLIVLLRTGISAQGHVSAPEWRPADLPPPESKPAGGTGSSAAE